MPNKYFFLACFFIVACLLSSKTLEAQWLERDQVEVMSPSHWGISDDLAEPPTVEEVLGYKEEFLYHVSYGFFHLGEVRVYLHHDTLYAGEPAMLLETRILANKNLPFVGYKEEHYKTYFRFEEGAIKPLYFFVDDLDDPFPKKTEYLFDYEKNQVVGRFEGITKDTLALEKGGSGGDIIFILSRAFAYDGGQYEMPVYVNMDKGPLTASTKKIGEMRNYKAFDGSVKTVRSEGQANFEGPFGFSGKFVSWFATDSTRIPLEAHAKVWIGNVKVRLERYKRHK